MSVNDEKASRTLEPIWATWGSPKIEARALHSLIGRGFESPESLRALIDVSPIDLKELSRWAQNRPELETRIESAINFRRKVLQEFNRLVEKQPG
jgi:hypothetical protein